MPNRGQSSYFFSRVVNVNGVVFLSSSLSGQVESRQVISGTEEGPRRPEKGQLLTSARARRRGRLGPLQRKCSSHCRQINLFETHAVSVLCHEYYESLLSLKLDS